MEHSVDLGVRGTTDSQLTDRPTDSQQSLFQEGKLHIFVEGGRDCWGGGAVVVIMMEVYIPRLSPLQVRNTRFGSERATVFCSRVTQQLSVCLLDKRLSRRFFEKKK